MPALYEFPVSTFLQSDLGVIVVGKMVRAVEARRSALFSFEFSTTLQVVQPDKET